MKQQSIVDFIQEDDRFLKSYYQRYGAMEIERNQWKRYRQIRDERNRIKWMRKYKSVGCGNIRQMLIRSNHRPLAPTPAMEAEEIGPTIEEAVGQMREFGNLDLDELEVDELMRQYYEEIASEYPELDDVHELEIAQPPPESPQSEKNMEPEVGLESPASPTSYVPTSPPYNGEYDEDVSEVVDGEKSPVSPNSYVPTSPPYNGEYDEDVPEESPESPEPEAMDEEIPDAVADELESPESPEPAAMEEETAEAKANDLESPESPEPEGMGEEPAEAAANELEYHGPPPNSPANSTSSEADSYDSRAGGYLLMENGKIIENTLMQVYAFYGKDGVRRYYDMESQEWLNDAPELFWEMVSGSPTVARQNKANLGK